MNAALKLDASTEASDPEQSQARLLAHAAASSNASDVSWVGKTIEGRYRINGLLGQATLGTVYLAHHVHTRKTLALKLLDPTLMVLGDAVPRFEREAVATARLNHPNVVTASDFGRLPDGVLYLVLEHVKGPSLRDVLVAGPLALERALSIVDQIVQGLGAVHALGMIHRGVKPENVLLAQRAAGELAKLQDFGLAVLTVDECQQDALTRIGTTPGTPEYRAPEQAIGHWVDARSDLYAVGVLLYEMITGHVPFAAEDAMHLLDMHVHDRVLPLPHAVPKAVGLLVRDLLEKDPERRIQSAPECAARIESVRAELLTAQSPALVTPEAPDSAAEFALPIQKSRTGWIAGVCALILLTGAVFTLIGQRTAEAPPTLSASVREVGVRVKAMQLVSAIAPSTGAEPGAKPDPRKKPVRDKASRVKRAQPAKARSKPASGARDTRRPAPPARRTGPFGIYVPPPNHWF